jgi:hypothetical protein
MLSVPCQRSECNNLSVAFSLPDSWFEESHHTYHLSTTKKSVSFLSATFGRSLYWLGFGFLMRVLSTSGLFPYVCVGIPHGFASLGFRPVGSDVVPQGF